MRALMAVGLAVAAAGLVVGLIPTSVTGTGFLADTVSCGSAFLGSDDAAGADLGSTLSGGGPWQGYETRCEARRSLMLVFALALLLPGMALAAAGAFIRPRPQPASR